MNKLLVVIIIAVLLISFMFALNYGMDKSAKVDCLHWQAQSEEFTQFYLTKWQSEQCNSVGIIINAPVK